MLWTVGAGRALLLEGEQCRDLEIGGVGHRPTGHGPMVRRGRTPVSPSGGCA
jgi:hypothetical protein